MKRWKVSLFVFTSGCVCALGWHCGLIPSLRIPSPLAGLAALFGL
jgi:hypothetical protein